MDMLGIYEFTHQFWSKTMDFWCRFSSTYKELRAGSDVFRDVFNFYTNRYPDMDPRNEYNQYDPTLSQ